jgi:outer membrane protein assembly factor BamB
MIVAIAPGCSTVKGWFGSSAKSKVNQPTELVKVASPIPITKLWSVSLGDGEGRLWLRQRPALDGGRLYVADDEGSVMALDAATGKRIWMTSAISVEATGNKLVFWRQQTVETGLTAARRRQRTS